MPRAIDGLIGISIDANNPMTRNRHVTFVMGLVTRGNDVIRSEHWTVLDGVRCGSLYAETDYCGAVYTTALHLRCSFRRGAVCYAALCKKIQASVCPHQVWSRLVSGI